MKIVVAREIIEQVKEFCYLGSMISGDITEKSREGQQQRRQSGLKSGGRGSGLKKFDFYRHISEKFQYFQPLLQKNIEFCRQISENFDIFRQIKISLFQAKNCPFAATSGQIIQIIERARWISGIDAAIGARGSGSRLVYYLTVQRPWTSR